MGIVAPPVLYPILPSQGPGRQVLYTTQYEHLDLLTPVKGGSLSDTTTIQEGLMQQYEFPLLFESSAFLTSPIVMDVNGDGIPDAILTDYDGGIYVMGLQVNPETGRRYFHKAQVPRLFVRRQWMESRVNETLGVDVVVDNDEEKEHPNAAGTTDDAPSDLTDNSNDNDNTQEKEGTHDPYHSYFEYTYGSSHEHEQILRGVTANVLGQDQEHVKTLVERRKRKISHKSQNDEKGSEGDEGGEDEQEVPVPKTAVETELDNNEVMNHRRLSEVVEEEMEAEVDGNHKAFVDDAAAAALNVDVQNGEVRQEGAAAAPAPAIEAPVQDFPPEYIPDPEEEQKTDNAAPEEVQVQPPGQDSRPEYIPDPAEEERKAAVAAAAAEQVENVRVDPPNSEEQQAEGGSEPNHQQQEVVVENNAENNAAPTDGDANHHQDPILVEERQAEEVTGDARDDDAMEGSQEYHGDDDYMGHDDDEQSRSRDGRWSGDDYSPYGDDEGDDKPHHDDEYPRYGGDDYYGRYNSESEDYYDDKHYVRIPPHVLCTPVLAEFPKLYNNNGETEHLLFLAVTYYLDEDEYEGFFSYKRFEETDHGDETEVKRGMYVANAIMVYQFGETPRWGRQEHLDLSGDHSAPVNTTLVGSIPLLVDTTKMGAFALSSPTVADIDGDGTMEVLLGTSMGFVYAMDARNLYTKENFPIQFQKGIEHRILVEDVLGDTNLELFVADVGGNVVCLDHKGNKLWHRDLASTQGAKSHVLASSPMVLGDVNGDGILDVVMFMKIRVFNKPDAHFLFALAADTGKDLPNFPVRIWSVSKDQRRRGVRYYEEAIHQKLPAPLLVDLHADQSFLKDYLHRNGAKYTKPVPNPTDKPRHGGNAGGLHIVQPVESNLIIMEAASGCFQSISIGDEILAMVQADDVHGTNSLDLVVSTASGNIVTLESQSPFHPLNVWNNGEMRGRTNSFAHGYSASQGIFVHEISRQFRDIFGVYVPVTFEIFDNRPNIQNEPDKRVYNVEIREGTSRTLFRKTYAVTGVYTERVYIPYGPGYYAVSVVLKTTHGLVYEDIFHLGYNVNYMGGFGLLLWLPLVIASACILLCGTSKSHWDDDDYVGDGRNGGQGILDSLPE
jgi:hypothetical protein